MVKFNYVIKLGWPYDHEFLKRKLTKYAKEHDLTLTRCEEDKKKNEESFTLEGNNVEVAVLRNIFKNKNEESLMSELVGA